MRSIAEHDFADGGLHYSYRAENLGDESQFWCRLSAEVNSRDAGWLDAEVVAVGGAELGRYLCVAPAGTEDAYRRVVGAMSDPPDSLLVVDRMFVEPAHRRMGVGSQLLGGLLSWASRGQTLCLLEMLPAVLPESPGEVELTVFYSNLGFTTGPDMGRFFWRLSSEGAASPFQRSSDPS